MRSGSTVVFDDKMLVGLHLTNYITGKKVRWGGGGGRGGVSGWGECFGKLRNHPTKYDFLFWFPVQCHKIVKMGQ